MTIKLTWTPGQLGTTQTIQYRLKGATSWSNYATVDNSTSVVFITLPDGAYEFRIVSDCDLCTCPEGYILDESGNCTNNGLTVPCTPVDASSNIFDVATGCQPPYVGVVTLIPDPPPPPPPSPTDPPLAQCLDGLILEFIYLDNVSDIGLLPTGYTLPCQSGMFWPDGRGKHQCNRAFFEVTANDIYIGDANMNNDGNGLFGGRRGVKTRSGKYTCKDEKNRPRALRPNNIWNGTRNSRYARIVITSAQAQQIAAATNSNQLALRLVPAMVTYNYDCSQIELGPHTDVTWFRVTRPNGQLLYNQCPTSYAATIDVCTNPISHP